ncbi:type II CAAX endopeptidase family protein [Bacillus tianshenii]|nr:type II CAAX endopeptidase family protein [Bacillus tianshenii]
MNKKQAALIRSMSDTEIIKQLYLTQLLMLGIAIFLSFFFFNGLRDLLNWFQLDWSEIITYGVGSAIIVIAIDVTLMKLLPKEMYDDGGINEKVFQRRPVWHILILTGLIAFSEEYLFRGVLQTQLGYISASILFALMHFRYLTKPVLLISVLLLSFYIGWVFEITHNLFVTITAHFLIDFIFACIIHFDYLHSLSGRSWFERGED